MPTISLTDLAETQYGTSTADSINASYATLETAVAACLAKAGDTMTGTLDMNSNRITNLPTPTTNSQPVTLGYLTTILAGYQTV